MDPRCDTRDPEEHAAIAAILAELPADHPARIAYAGQEDTIRLTHLVGPFACLPVVVYDLPSFSKRIIEGTKRARPASYS